jgi:hypothetical protein
MNDPEVNRELIRLVDEVARLHRQMDAQQQAHEQALAARQVELDSAQQSLEALGKAIALLHAGNGSAGSTTGH